MKKAIALMLSAALVFVLFAACSSGDTTTTPTPAPTSASTPAPTSSTSTGSTPAPADVSDGTYDAGILAPPREPHSSDNLAVTIDGRLKYAVDEFNYPLDWYDYELPLTTDSTTFTYWAISFMTSYIPADGMGTMAYYSYLRDKTGVNIEYNVATDAQQNFSIMLASDDFTDILSNAGTYWGSGGGGSAENMILQNYIVNIADYRAYAPNFMYLEPHYGYDQNLHAAMWLTPTIITSMGFLIENQLPGTGLAIRGDWLDRLDGAPQGKDIWTYDELHDVLTRFKNEIFTGPEYDANNVGYPMLLGATIEAGGTLIFGGMDTGLSLYTPQTKVQPKSFKSVFTSNTDKVVSFTLMDEIDYEALTLLTTWFTEGLINPGYTEFSTSAAQEAEIFANRTGLIIGNPGAMAGYAENSTTPGVRWEAIHNPAKTRNWQFKYGNGFREWGMFNGFGWSYNAKASNIPLLVSYGDWFYSEEGCTIGTWGIEGLTFEYDANGNMYKTDFVINNDINQPVAWFMMLYGQNSFTEPIRQNHLANYAYPAGEYYKNMFYLWQESGYLRKPGVESWDWPGEAKLSIEQSNEVATFQADANTLLSETYVLFMDRSQPLTKENWDAYSKSIRDVGYDRYQGIMQIVYEDYMAANG